MKIKRLKLSEIKDIYRKYLFYDFPIEERRPLPRITKHFRAHNYEGYGGYDEEGRLLCYAFFFTNRYRTAGPDGKTVRKKACLLDYLAVMKDVRDRGVGSVFLKELVRHFAGKEDLVFIEVENADFARTPEEKATRERRMAFYLRNGMIETGVCALVWTVEYRIIEIDFAGAGVASWTPHTPEEIREACERTYHSMFPPVLYEHYIEVR
ncbi:MAG: GNAT family N-acetyltransferase [Lachnospiraceae bacterium]|nr:GNAT family N-acetyltransferase [Lachnospiraceae bacterium]